MTVKEAFECFVANYPKWEKTPEARPTEDLLKRLVNARDYKAAAKEVCEAISKLDALTNENNFFDIVISIVGDQDKILLNQLEIPSEHGRLIKNKLNPIIKKHFRNAQDDLKRLQNIYNIGSPLKSYGPTWVHKFYKATAILFRVLADLVNFR